MSITNHTLQMHQKDCDKCCGTGIIHDAGIYELIKRWRQGIGISAKAFATLVGVPYTSYCKFENGRVVFSEARIRILIQMLTLKEPINRNKT